MKWKSIKKKNNLNEYFTISKCDNIFFSSYYVIYNISRWFEVIPSWIGWRVCVFIYLFFFMKKKIHILFSILRIIFPVSGFEWFKLKGFHVKHGHRFMCYACIFFLVQLYPFYIFNLVLLTLLWDTIFNNFFFFCCIYSWKPIHF